MSASSENLSGTLTRSCSTAIASVMTAGKFDGHSTLGLSSLERMALLVLANKQSGEANTMEEDQAHASADLLGPSGDSVQQLEDGQMSSHRL